MVTAFTIVFVAIVATTIRRYALWRAQNGAYISDMEQLHASISLPDTIKMIFYLRKFSLLTGVSLVVWCFYYLGCQAQEWEYTFGLSGPWHYSDAAYSNDAARFNFNGTREEPESMIDYINTRMKVILETPSEALLFEPPGVDVDRDVLIPDMRYEKSLSSKKGGPLRQRSQKELQSWMMVHPSMDTFVTGHGQRLYFHLKDLHKNDSKNGMWEYAGPPEGEKVIGEFTFKTSYLNAQCGSIRTQTISRFPGDPASNMSTSLNMTTTLTTNGLPTPRSFDIWHKWTPSYWADLGYNRDPPVINGLASGTLQISCNITRPDVEVQAKCSETSCVPRQMRYLADEGNHQYITPFDDDTWAFEFFDNYLWSTGEPESTTTNATGETIIERSLNLQSFIGLLPNDASAKLTYGDTNTLLSSFSPNMTRSLNTYFNIGISVGVPSPATAPELYNTFTFHGALYAPAYRLHWAWIVLDYLSCVLLLAAASWSLWLRKHTLAPDIFGYVSSLTRDNPHVPVEGGSALSGVDRAKLMGKVKIRIGNVGEDGDVGKVGIVYIHEDATIIPLSKDRKYL